MKERTIRRLALLLTVAATLASFPARSSAFTWAQRADVIGQQFGRGLHGAGTINNQIVVAGGGFIGTSLWISFRDAVAYNPMSDTWSTLASMSKVRTAPGSAVARFGGSERLYVIGGMDLTDFPIDHFTQRDIEEYDPVSNTWRVVGVGFPDRQTWGTCAVAIDNDIFIMGGVDDGFANLSDRLVAYDPDADAYAPLTPMPLRVSDGACAAVGRKIYWFSGYDINLGWGSLPGAGTFVYDVDLGTWTVARPTPTPRANAAAIAIGTKVYVIGGWDGSGQYGGLRKTVDAYDTTTDTWTPNVPDPLGCAPDDLVSVRGRSGLSLHEADDGTAVRVFAVGGNIGISIPTRCNESSPRSTTTTDVDPPLFTGLGGATEVGSCSLPPSPNVRLEWVAGTDLTPPVVYDIYRGTTAIFTPGPATLVASRVSGVSYIDMLPPTACFQSFWYVVRAEDSASPPNVETNTNRVQVDLVCAPSPTPTDVGNVLRVVKDPARLPELEWSLYTPGMGVTHYHVRRTVSKLGLPGTTVSEPQPQSWVDGAAPGSQYLYQVRSANTCETESQN